jgi:hypothetical protein
MLILWRKTWFLIWQGSKNLFWSWLKESVNFCMLYLKLFWTCFSRTEVEGWFSVLDGKRANDFLHDSETQFNFLFPWIVCCQRRKVFLKNFLFPPIWLFVKNESFQNLKYFFIFTKTRIIKKEKIDFELFYWKL